MKVVVRVTSRPEFPEKKASNISVNVVVPRHYVQLSTHKSGCVEKLVEELGSDGIFVRLTRKGNVPSCKYQVRSTAVPLPEAPNRSYKCTKYDNAII
jgi:hypothetical protein